MKTDIKNIIAKFKQLEVWLVANPEHINRNEVQSDYLVYHQVLEEERQTSKKRFDELYVVLQYDSEYKKVLSTSQRIAINQERGSLIEYIETIEGKYAGQMRLYQVSPQLEVIIQKTLHIIKEIKWKSNINN